MFFMSMSPSKPLKYIAEMLFFVLLCIPGVLWACLKKLFKPKKKSVKGQVVLITGAAQGLGRELAIRFGQLGAKVACVDVKETGNNETVSMIKTEGWVAASFTCDVSNRDQIKTMHALVRDVFGPVDLLINNAGIVWGNTFVDPTKDQFIIDIINVNLLGQIWMIREILPSMLDRNSGHIVAISSMASVRAVAGFSMYTLTKFATNGMMECLNNELKDYFNSNVKTTTVLPYYIQTNPTFSELLDLRLPEIPTKTAGKIIVKGILEEQRVFSVPRNMIFLASIVRILPDNLQAVMNRIVYVRGKPDIMGEEIIKKYKQTNTRAI